MSNIKSKKNYSHTKQIQSLNASAKSADIRSGVGVYLDYAASTPVDSKASKAMAPYYSEIFGNPGSLHKFGQEVSAVVFKARNKISKLINSDYREIVFTGSATEANNLAIRGVIKNFYNQLITNKYEFTNKDKKNDKISTFVKISNSLIKPRIIVSAIEHESVLEVCRELEKENLAEVVYLPVSKGGMVDLKKLKNSLNEKTVLVSIMYANNEIGSIQPIKEISKIIYSLKEECFSSDLYPLFHTDAAQAFNYLDCDVKELGVDMMTLSSQKIYGPKGVGLLYIKNFGSIEGEKFISPLITGGGQEEGLRSGTENVAGIVGMSEAAQLAFDLRKKESQRLYKLQNYFISQVKKIFPKVVLNGPVTGEQRLPNNVNIYFPGKKDLIFKLDFAGFAVSGGSACSARLAKPSHVLKALGCSDEKASESIRISFGRQTTQKEINRLLVALKRAL